jgi:hypothetical protein
MMLLFVGSLELSKAIDIAGIGMRIADSPNVALGICQFYFLSNKKIKDKKGELL